MDDPMLCVVDDCKREIWTREYCRIHYMRWCGRPADADLTKTLSSPKPFHLDSDFDAERFWKHVRKTPTCWVWVGDTTSKGYGRFRIGSRWVRAHRVAYQLDYGTIPTGLLCLHHCDNPPCVREDHLYLGTAQDNMNDALQRNRTLTTHPRRKVVADVA